ncbi:MAG: chemotaxis response regulator protein-glutamate methylesterase [Planctomycetota bacterium]
MNVPLRVLAVDDSVVFRKVVSDVVASDPDLQLVGTASNGRICMQKIQQLNPDVITLDLEMPEMDGFAVLREMKKTHPHIKAIVFSIHSERGADRTFEAMKLGASDFLSKDINLGSREDNFQYFLQELLPRIKQFCKPELTNEGLKPWTRDSKLFPMYVDKNSPKSERKVSPPPVQREAPKSLLIAPAPSRTGNATRSIIAVGVSTGGPNALAAFLPMLSASLPVPIVIVQHMPAMFTRLLAERLNASCKINVKEAVAGEELKDGTAYIAPGDYHLVLKRLGTKVITQLNQDPQENSCRPAVDVLFRSVADIYGEATIAVILTGMGKDGFEGIRLLKNLGAHVVAQDKETSVVWGMPGFVVEAGLANSVVPIQHVAIEVERCLISSKKHPA